MSRSYVETFDDGPGGWCGWRSNAEGFAALEATDDGVTTRSPWWIDYNHAPPGGGYLHIMFGLLTGRRSSAPEQLCGRNRFLEGGYPTDFTGAEITVRLRGEVELRSAELTLLAQAKVGSHYVNHVLTAQPLDVASGWSEQTLRLEPDPAQWHCLGSRFDRTDHYGDGEVADVLRDVNDDIIFILYPLDVVPDAPLADDMHRMKAGEDYPVNTSRLPSGSLTMGEIRIDFR